MSLGIVGVLILLNFPVVKISRYDCRMPPNFEGGCSDMNFGGFWAAGDYNYYVCYIVKKLLLRCTWHLTFGRENPKVYPLYGIRVCVCVCSHSVQTE